MARRMVVNSAVLNFLALASNRSPCIAFFRRLHLAQVSTMFDKSFFPPSAIGS